jgi:hypothetical protein
MSNPWIKHVKKYALDNNMSYACALSEASKTYKKKGLKPTLKFKIVNEQLPNEVVESFDTISGELQKLLYSSGQQKIIKALTNLKFKGKLQASPILRTMQILQNFNTIPKMKSLINELKVNI